MKVKLLLAAFLVFAAVACTKESTSEKNQGDPVVNYVPMTFTASTEDVSKVLLMENHVSLSWQTADRIKIFDGSSANLPFVSSGEGEVVDFYGNVVNESGPFYALYPYQNDATYGLDAKNNNAPTIYAEVPAVQTAVAGSVPSDAFIAAAKSGPDGLLSFRTMLGFIRFTLNDSNAANIESITLSGNNGEGITGGLKITFDADGVPTDTYISGDVHRYVTLVGTFENGKDYIFAIREQPSFDRGVTISILYKDGTRRYISSEANFVDKSGNPIEFVQNTVLNISSLMAEQMKSERPKDRWVAYLHGYDLEIAGEVYNMATHGEPTKLLKAKTADTPYNAREDIQEKSGVFFIDSSVGDVELGLITTISGDLVALIGRYEDQPNVITPKYFIKVCSGRFVMKDLYIDTENIVNEKGESCDYVFTLSDGPKDIELIHMDECKIKNLRRRLFYYHDNNTKCVVKELRCVNSDIGIKTIYNTIQLFYLQKYINLHTIREITFDNNIVYHDYRGTEAESGYKEATTCRIVDIPTAGCVESASWDAVVSICNNTMYNVPSPWAYFNYYKVASLKMNKNISAVSDNYDAYSGCMCLFRGDQAGDVIDISDNVYYGLTKQNWLVAPDQSTWKPSVNNMTPYESAVNPFKTIDFDTGTFVPRDEYAAYGAQR